MRRLADLTAVCVLSLSLGGCAIAPSLGASVAMWAATKGLEFYLLKESPTMIVGAPRSRVATAIGDVLGSLAVEQASVALVGGEAHIIEAALPVEGRVLITLIPLGGDATKVNVTARTGGLGPDVDVAKDILGRIRRALEGPPTLVREKPVT